MRIASVLIPLPLPEAFDYAEPEGMELMLGEVVAVPLGPRLVRGAADGALRDGAGGNRALKPVAGRMEAPPLPAQSLAFIDWAARYAVDQPGQPLAIALRGSGAPKAKRRARGDRHRPGELTRMTAGARQGPGGGERATPW